jgi:hypothetical protein
VRVTIVASEEGAQHAENIPTEECRSGEASLGDIVASVASWVRRAVGKGRGKACELNNGALMNSAPPTALVALSSCMSPTKDNALVPLLPMQAMSYLWGRARLGSCEKTAAAQGTAALPPRCRRRPASMR